VSTIEELLERKDSGYGLKNRECFRRDLSRKTLTLTLLTRGGRWVGIVRLWTHATELGRNN
jgi:hypothetical protein